MSEHANLQRCCCTTDGHSHPNMCEDMATRDDGLCTDCGKYADKAALEELEKKINWALEKAEVADITSDTDMAERYRESERAFRREKNDIIRRREQAG